MLKQLMLASTAIWALAMPALAQEATEEAATETTTEEAAPAYEEAGRDTVLATVNGTEITVGHLISAAQQLPEQYRQLPPDILFDGVLTQLVQQQVLADTVDGISDQVQIELDNNQRTLQAGFAVQGFLETAVSDEQIQARYDETYSAENAQTEYNAAHILVASQEEAQAVLDRLNAGEDFAALAQELSTDTGSGANGGDLGWFTPDLMVEPFSAAVVAMEAGTVGGPVETQFGWHIIRLNETRAQAAPPIDLVRDQIRGELQSAAIEQHVSDLEAAATITRAEPGQFDPALVNAIDLLTAE